MLFEALTGNPPFFADSPAELLYQHVHDEPPRLSRLCPDAHPQLRDLVHGLLAKDPANRPGNASDVARHLAALFPVAQVPDAEATQVLPPVPVAPVASGLTELLPRVAETTGVAAHSSRRRPRERNRQEVFLIGALAVLAILVGVPLALVSLSNDDTGRESSATSAAAPTSSPTPTSSPSPSAEPAFSSPTASPSASTPSATPRTSTASSGGPQALADDLNSAFAGASGTMPADLARETQLEIAEINKKLQDGETDKAAEKARDLRQRLTDAQQKGKWSGDSTLMGLLGQLAAS